MDEMYFYEPGKGRGLPHDPFKAIVAPRPSGWIRNHLAPRRRERLEDIRRWGSTA